MPTQLPGRSERRRTAEAWEIEVDERGCVPGLDFFLFDQDGRLSIARLDAPRDGALCVDFSTIEVRRGGAAHSGQQPLIKACAAVLSRC